MDKQYLCTGRLFRLPSSIWPTWLDTIRSIEINGAFLMTVLNISKGNIRIYCQLWLNNSEYSQY